MPQVTFGKAVCCRGHEGSRGQDPVSMCPAAACRGPEHPSRWSGRAGGVAAALGIVPSDLGIPHGLWDVPPLCCYGTDKLSKCLDFKSLRKKVWFILSVINAPTMCWLGLTPRWIRNLPQSLIPWRMAGKQGLWKVVWHVGRSWVVRQLCLGAAHWPLVQMCIVGRLGDGFGFTKNSELGLHCSLTCLYRRPFLSTWTRRPQGCRKRCFWESLAAPLGAPCLSTHSPDACKVWAAAHASSVPVPRAPSLDCEWTGLGWEMSHFSRRWRSQKRSRP